MKTLCMALWVLTIEAAAQTVYTLEPCTQGNRIELTVANATSATALQQVVVKVVHHPEGIVFDNLDQTIEAIAPQGYATVRFTFEVGRPRQDVVSGVDTMRFLIMAGNGTSSEKVILVRYALPTRFALEQNYPNPFNPVTRIAYQVPVAGRVTLKVYDVLGRAVRTLVDEEKAAGYYEEVLDATQLASGVYFYRMQAGSFTAMRKLLVVK